MKTTTKLLLSLFIGFGLVSCSDDNSNLDIELGNKEAAGFVLTDTEKSSVDLKNNGFYVVNEDWFGHSNSSINYFKPDGTIEYRAYRNANPGEELGVTTAVGTIYGDNMFFTSKQGNRLVVADKTTLKKKAALVNIGSDGRAVIGVSPTKAYVSISGGVVPFDLTTYTVGGMIEGLPSTQAGKMVYANNHVIVIMASGRGVPQAGAYLIDAKEDKFVKSLEIDNAISVVRSMDGNIWVISSNKLVCLNPMTFENIKEVDISTAGAAGSWGAWNAGPITASNTENTLYWCNAAGMFGAAKKIHKYDIDKGVLTPDFFSVGKEQDYGVEKDFDGPESTSNIQLSLYGAGVRVHPVSGELYLLIKRDGWGDNGSYNWVFIVDTDGKFKKAIAVSDDIAEGETGTPKYYWFPSHPLFKDECKPQILVDKIELEAEKPLTVELASILFDEDNSIFLADVELKVAEADQAVVKFELKEHKLYATPLAEGEATLTIVANSNGNVVEKTIPVSVFPKKD